MSDWPIKSIGDLATFHRGITWASSQETEKPEPGCVPVLRIPNVQERLETTSILFLRGISLDKRIRYAATRDWLLMVGSNGNPDRVGDCVRITHDTDYLFASFLVGVEPNKQAGADPCFIHYLLRSDSVRKAVSDSIKGTTGLRNISLSHLAAHEFRCPPPAQQRKIARILTTVDNLIEKTEALIAKYQAIKQGMMHDLFTRGVDEHGHLRPPYEQAPELYKQSELGWIPKEWEAHNLGDVAGLQVGYAFKSSWFRDDGGFRLLRGENVGNGRPDWSEVKFLASTMAPQFNEYTLQPGDVVIGMDRTFTKMGVKITLMRAEDCPSLLVQRVGRFLPRQCGSDFLRAFLSYERYHADLARQQKGMDIPHLSQSEILEPLIPLPPKNEQHRISARITSLEASISSECENLEKMTRNKTGLMQDLLTGKVRVQVDDAEEVAG